MTYLTTAPVGSLLDGEAYYTTRFRRHRRRRRHLRPHREREPSLTSAGFRAVLRESCEKIDVESNTHDERGHSPLYGYGRPNIACAVELARQH